MKYNVLKSFGLGILVVLLFSQCGLILVGGAFAGLNKMGDKHRPKIDAVATDTAIIIEEAITEVEAIEELAEPVSDPKDLPKSDTGKVDRSIFPEDVLGGGTNSNMTELKLFDPEVDKGTIVYGDSILHTFRYQNVGSKEFVIEQYTVGCGCTQMTEPKKRLAPGEMGEITLQFNSKEKDGPGEYTSDAMLIGNTGEGFVEFKISIKVVAKEE